jgi:hypothetical protein
MFDYFVKAIATSRHQPMIALSFHKPTIALSTTQTNAHHITPSNSNSPFINNDRPSPTNQRSPQHHAHPKSDRPSTKEQ